HNVGFLAIDALVEKWKGQGPQKKFNAEVFSAEIFNEKVHLIKPQTYMNLSGKSIGEFFHYYHCTSSDLIVIHDDLDLPIFSLKLKTGGGTGGHKGLESLFQHLGKDHLDFYRIRIGIGHPRILGRSIAPEKYVLETFSAKECKTLSMTLTKVCEAIELALGKNFSKAMTEYNKASE
ncbi:MAG: aminoacyl-tRNA hydrolase, partial [Bdellovibrio sp.]|nr:aminoacyl-tRNA hydrolase [Bdellovibrio sp.]